MAQARSGGALPDIRSLYRLGTATHLSDAELLGRFAARQTGAGAAADEAEAAFAALVARHGPMVLGVCRRALANPEDIEDAFQATFLVLVRKAAAVRIRGSLGAWLHVVARRTAARASAKSRRRTAAAELTVEPAVSGVDEALAELHTALDEEIERLPERFRSPLILCCLEGVSHAEAARRLGWPIGTVSGRLSRARQLLRKRLTRRGFGLAAGALGARLRPGAATAAVPETLVKSTCRIAARIATGAVTPTGTLPVGTLDLAELAFGGGLVSRVKTAVAVLAAVGTVAVGACVWARNAGRAPEGNRPGVTGLKNPGLAAAARRDEPHETDRSTIHFPADRPIGVLYTRPRDAKEWPGSDWSQLREAVGEVTIPAGRQVRLELSAGNRAGLSPLRRIEPDRLQSLHVRDTDLRGEALADLAHLTGLEEVNLLNSPIGDEGARHLAGLPRLKYLGISGCRVGDEGLARLAGLPELERLDLGHCWVTEAGLAHVGRIRSLRSLSLYRSDIDDQGLVHLGGLPVLESLRLADCLHISDSGLAHLRGLSHLRNLDLESAPITDAGLTHLARLANLENLNLAGTKVTDAGLVHLRGLGSLHRLSLPQGISDAGLAHVGAIRPLRDLTIRPGRVTDRGVAALSGLDQLRELNFHSGVKGSHVTDAAAAHLAGLPALRRLVLGSTEIGDGGLEALAGAKSLEWLLLYGNRVTSEGLRHLARLPALTRLELSGIRGPGGGLSHLSSLKGLTILKIYGDGWLGVDGGGGRPGDRGLGDLSGLTRLESLTVDLPLTDEGMRHLAGLTSLRWLEVRNTNNRITDDGLACVSRMPGLTQLLVSGWITDRGLTHLEGLRSLYRVSLGSRPGAISNQAAAALKVRNPSIQVMDYPRKRAGDPSPPTAGRAAPDLEVETFDGQKVQLSKLKGKTVLLHFWATWCTPCLEETPRLKAFVEGRRGAGRAFEAISLNLDDDAHWAKRHARRNQLNWPQAWVGVDSPACSAYGVNSAPHYVVIRPDGKIAYAGRDFEAATEAADRALEPPLPDDPLLAEQWYLHSPGGQAGSPGGIGATEAWRHIRPAEPIVVAVADLGMDDTHPDLAPNLWKNVRETPNGKDDDGNGYVDDLHGWDFAYATNNPISRPSRKFPEQHDHGTAVASLIAAVPNNGLGTAGVGRNVRIMNLRVGGEGEFEGQEFANLDATLPQAIRYAVRNGARVIVCTARGLKPSNRAFQESLREADGAGVLFVQAAGNQGKDIDDDPEFEFLSQSPNVILVGGTARDGTLEPRLNYGKRVGIVAPSVDMVFPSFGRYVRAKGPGTSFSAPIVAAVAATLLSQSPDLTPKQVIGRLREASVFEPGMEGKIGGGRLDMAQLFRP